jgi:hypothetical protein
MSDEHVIYIYIYITSVFYDLVSGKQKPRTAFLQEREDDMTLLTTLTSIPTSSIKMTTSPTKMATSPTNMTTSPTMMTTSSSQATTTTPAHVFDGPFNRNQAMKLQQEVHAQLCELHFNIDENYILHKLCILLLLRFTKEDDKDTPRMNQRDGPHRISST